MKYQDPFRIFDHPCDVTPARMNEIVVELIHMREKINDARRGVFIAYFMIAVAFVFLASKL